LICFALVIGPGWILAWKIWFDFKIFDLVISPSWILAGKIRVYFTHFDLVIGPNGILAGKTRFGFDIFVLVIGPSWILAGKIRLDFEFWLNHWPKMNFGGKSEVWIRKCFSWLSAQTKFQVNHFIGINGFLKENVALLHHWQQNKLECLRPASLLQGSLILEGK
jgi:hypothetical protein